MMRKKILIFGARGMFGHVAAAYFKQQPDFEVICSARQMEDGISLDVTDFPAVEETIRTVGPDFVLNAVGLLVKACDDSADMAVLLNSYFPHYLAKLSRKYSFKLIHISTDCVFSGRKGAYREDDLRDGDTFYARSKALGEIEDERNLTVRTSIIGPELKQSGTGLFHWFMQQHGNIKGYSRAFWSGVTTLELACFVHAAINADLTGIYQLSMLQKISKYDLLCLFRKIWNKEDVAIEPFDGYICDKSLIGSQRDGFEYKLPADYEEMLQQMKNFKI